jgi:type IV secretion system protein TrbE
MFEHAPNGHFLQDMIIFGGLRKGGHVAKGFIFEPPDLTAAAPAHLNNFQDQISLLLCSLHKHQRLQVQWFCDSDYRTELLRYRDETELATNTWTRRCRNDRFTRYCRQCSTGSCAGKSW